MKRFICVSLMAGVAPLFAQAPKPAGAKTTAVAFDRTKPPVSAPPHAYKLPPVYETKLPNGLTVMLVNDPRLPLATVRLAFLAGNKRDPKDIPGLAGSVAEMLTQGTRTRSYQKIAEELDAIGGNLNAGTGADSLIVNGSVLAENLPALLGLMADVTRNATFPQDELDLHKENRAQTLEVEHSDPAYLANEMFRARIFGDHPYSHIGPTSVAIQKLDRKVLADYRDAFLVPNNAFLILVGKLPARLDALKVIAANFGTWQRKAVPAYSAGKPPESKRQLVIVDRPGSVQADIRIGKVAAANSAPDYFAEMMGSIIEGGGAHSRLFDDIREKRGYAYDVHTENTALADAGALTVVTQVRNDVISDALKGVLDHLDRMAREPVTAEELSESKSYENGIYLLRLEPQAGLADQLAQMKVMNLPKDYLEAFTTRVNSTEPDQIEAAAKKYMAPADSTIVVVGDAAKISDALQSIGKFELVKAKQ